MLSRHHFRTRAEARAGVSPLVPGLLQRQTTAQLGGVAGSGRVRENRCHPAGRSLNEASTISGETQYDLPIGVVGRFGSEGGGSEFDGCRFSALIDLGELVFGGGDADLKAFDFAEPRSPLRRVGGAVEGGPVGLKCSFPKQPP